MLNVKIVDDAFSHILNCLIIVASIDESLKIHTHYIYSVLV